jgi:NitT/TauT family transport system permease protein
VKLKAVSLVRNVVPPVALLLLVLVVWEAAVLWFQIPVYLLPGPLRVGRAAVENLPQLAQSTALTATAAGGGFVSSLVAGVLVAFVFSQSRVIRNSCYPYAIFLQTVPIVAIAPLIITWFDYGFQSVVIVAFIISLFPIITNATTGMIAVDPQLVDLFRLHNATRWQILIKLRLPNSVPYVVTGAKSSSGLAVVGAIVGEFFVGAGSGRFGLGFLIRQKLEHLKTAELFAAVIAATLLGVAIFATVSAAGATLLSRWYNPATDEPD